MDSLRSEKQTLSGYQNVQIFYCSFKIEMLQTCDQSNGKGKHEIGRPKVLEFHSGHGCLDQGHNVPACMTGETPKYLEHQVKETRRCRQTSLICVRLYLHQPSFVRRSGITHFCINVLKYTALHLIQVPGSYCTGNLTLCASSGWLNPKLSLNKSISRDGSQS